MMRWLGRWLVLFAIDTLLGMGAGAVLMHGGPPPAPGALPFALLANAIVVATAMLVAARLADRGPWRALTLFALLFGPQANNLVELLIFPLDAAARMLLLLVLQAAVVSAGAEIALDAIVPGGPSAPSCWPRRRGAGGWIMRVLACDVGYIVVYLAAGMLVWPFVRPFYAGRAMPAMGTIVAMQVLRGLVFVALLALLANRLRAGRRSGVLLGGIAFAVFSAWALLIPNPFFPDFARLAHLCEVGVSNLCFGGAVMLVLTAGGEPAAAGAPAPTPAA